MENEQNRTVSIETIPHGSQIDTLKTTEENREKKLTAIKWGISLVRVFPSLGMSRYQIVSKNCNDSFIGVVIFGDYRRSLYFKKGMEYL